MNNQEKLKSFIRGRLDSFYSNVKATGVTDELESHYISGIMATCRVLDVMSKKELGDIAEEAHRETFGMDADERRIAIALEEGGEHWNFFETPIFQRR